MAKKKQKQTMSRSEKRRLAINADMLLDVQPLTPNQERIFKAWKDGKHMWIYGCAGTGKTFTALYNALTDTLKDDPTYDKIYLTRSLVAVRDIGALPGDLEEKTCMWQAVYANMVKYMFEFATEEEFTNLYERLRSQQTIEFLSTSFLRGMTIDDSVIIVDEMQNLTNHELDSIITRVGDNTRIIFCGDSNQSDKPYTTQIGGSQFPDILRTMPDDFEMIEMTTDDIVRSGLVRRYLLAKEALST